MKIISRFVQEQRRYTKNELRNLFCFEQGGVEKFIRKLKAYNVLKTVKNSFEQKELTDLLEEDIKCNDEVESNDLYLYVFTYVGVITIGSRVLKIYPKYIRSVDEPVEEMKQIIQVLNKYSNSDEQVINIYNANDQNTGFNLISVILFLINDYYEYGVYTNTEDIIEVNGEGQIRWQTTIDQSFTLIKDNRPYYTELYTDKIIDDPDDYFRRLHECVLTECSKQLMQGHLDELFGLNPVLLSEETLSDFGEKEYILEKIQNELSVEFNTRKQILLKTLYTYIAQDQKLFDYDKGISMFGTTVFNMVWEKVCAKVFDNQLATPIGKLKLSKAVHPEYDKKMKLIDLIEKPVWQTEDAKIIAKETLRPDLISVGCENGVDYFVILDAKYYNIQLEKGRNLKSTPGVGDVTKQYLYQLAYKKFIEDHQIKLVRNCFLFPIEGTKIINKGRVTFEMMKQMGLEDIEVVLLPAKEMYKKYLRDEVVHDGILCEDIDFIIQFNVVF